MATFGRKPDGDLFPWERHRPGRGSEGLEQALFFEGKWSGDGTALVYGVAKPSYQPSRGRRIAVRTLVEGLFDVPDPVPVPMAVNVARPPRSWFDRLFD
jgi:lysozyme